MLKTSPALQQRLISGENLRKIFARSRFRFFDSDGELLIEMTGHKMRHIEAGMSMEGRASGAIKKPGILATFRLDDYGNNWIDGTCGHGYPADMLFSSTWGYENAVFNVDSFILDTSQPVTQEPDQLECGLLYSATQKLFKWLRRDHM